MERATTSLPTPVSPRMSTFALLRAAMSMLRRNVIVVSLSPSSTADPRTDFPIDRILLPSGGLQSAQTRSMVHACARTIFDPKCQGSFTQRDAILQVVGAWHQG